MPAHQLLDEQLCTGRRLPLLLVTEDHYKVIFIYLHTRMGQGLQCVHPLARSCFISLISISREFLRTDKIF